MFFNMKKAITILEVFLNTNRIIKVALRTSLRLFVHFYLERFELGTKFNNDIFFFFSSKQDFERIYEPTKDRKGSN